MEKSVVKEFIRGLYTTFDTCERVSNTNLSMLGNNRPQKSLEKKLKHFNNQTSIEINNAKPIDPMLSREHVCVCVYVCMVF